jgi:hypothetical protein
MFDATILKGEDPNLELNVTGYRETKEKIRKQVKLGVDSDESRG